MRRSPAVRTSDPPLAFRALVGVVVLLAVGVVARSQLDMILARVGLRPIAAVPQPVEPLGTTSAVTPLIARVDVHPERVCRGQDVVVEVALTPGHASSTVAIKGRNGTRAVLRFAGLGEEVVPIVARDRHDGVQVRHLRLKVEDCGAAQYPEVASR